MYTSSSYPCFNKPLRDRQKPHPFAMSVYYLADALKNNQMVEELYLHYCNVNDKGVAHFLGHVPDRVESAASPWYGYLSAVS